MSYTRFSLSVGATAVSSRLQYSTLQPSSPAHKLKLRRHRRKVKATGKGKGNRPTTTRTSSRTKIGNELLLLSLQSELRQLGVLLEVRNDKLQISYRTKERMNKRRTSIIFLRNGYERKNPKRSKPTKRNLKLNQRRAVPKGGESQSLSNNLSNRLREISTIPL